MTRHLLATVALPTVAALALFGSACTQPDADRAFADQADALVAAYHEAGLFDGAILVAQGERILYDGAVGQADRAWGIANTPDTRFRIASVTKQFTAALVLQLVEEGLVDLHAPISTYLPESPEYGDRVTVHHLLAHTSGVPEEGADLLFVPGARYQYSNPNYTLLARIAEAVAGQLFAGALRDRLLAPLGLDGIQTAHYGEVVERLARGYARTPFGHREEDPFLDGHPYGSGELAATAGELLRWTRALHRAEPFENPATLDLMRRPHADAGRTPYGPYAYGYGLMVLTMDADSSLVYMHDGRLGPFVSDVRYLPEGDYTVVALGNAEGGETAVTIDVANGLVDLLRGREAPQPKRPIAFEVGTVIEADGVEAAVARYRRLATADDSRFAFDEDALNGLGYAYLHRGDLATAVRLFELNVETYPEAPNPHDSLGETYLAHSDTARAVAHYRRALALDPDYPNAEAARSVLARIGAK